MFDILIAVLVVTGIGLICGIILAVVSKFTEVKTDETVAEWPKGSQASCGVWREDSGLDSRPCRKSAIIAHALPNCDSVQEISIIPRGHAGGYTLTLDEQDRTHMTKQKLLDSITMMLGGRAAEEVMLNDITTGASNDIERATAIARKMVAEWGMSENASAAPPAADVPDAMESADIK